MASRKRSLEEEDSEDSDFFANDLANDLANEFAELNEEPSS